MNDFTVLAVRTVRTVRSCCTHGGFSGASTSLLITVQPRFSVLYNCLMHCCFANTQLFTYLSFRLTFPAQNHYLGPLTFSQRCFFADFLQQEEGGQYQQSSRYGD